MPKQAVCELVSLSPYQCGKYVLSPREEKETHDDHEHRTWKERAHIDDTGRVFLPAMGFRHSITDAARFLGSAGELGIPGRGKATYTKHFEAGLLVENDLTTPFTLETVHPLWLFVPSDGRRGGGSRVMKCFPVLPQWEGTIKVMVLDDTITEAVFERVIREAGNFIGVGSFRPQNRGHYGRFTVKEIAWVAYAPPPLTARREKAAFPRKEGAGNGRLEHPASA